MVTAIKEDAFMPNTGGRSEQWEVDRNIFKGCKQGNSVWLQLISPGRVPGAVTGIQGPTDIFLTSGP